MQEFGRNRHVSDNQVIGAYTLHERIGTGLTSIVYRAVETETGREVAIKLLARALAFSAYARSELKQEIERISALRHPQIVPILQTGMFREQVYFVLPYFAAGSLALNQPWTVEAAKGLVEGLVAPLDAAHAAGIAHGRLKPTNIFVTENGLPHVADFGLQQLSMANSGGWRGNAMRPTPYTAPEQLTGYPTDARTDIFALARLLERMTGKDAAELGIAQALADNPRERSQNVSQLAQLISLKPKRRRFTFFGRR